MKVLVLGASGATGRLVVMQLLKRQINTRIVVRESAILSGEMQDNPHVEIVKGNIAEFDNSGMIGLLKDCDAVVSCLGHTITFKGMFGEPRNLVFDALKTVCGTVVRASDKKVKLVLMSTTAYTNSGIGEKNSFGEKVVFSLLKLLLPPHIDNVKAADYLNEEIGKNNEKLEWIAVRPDTLINRDDASAYAVHESPIRSPIFNAGTTSRINVGRFMVELLLNEESWREWKFKMPVIYNRD
jgi:nucleoside-diphosphate-sugar epimerase